MDTNKDVPVVQDAPVVQKKKLFTKIKSNLTVKNVKKGERQIRDMKRLMRQHIQRIAMNGAKSNRYIQKISWIVETVAIGAADIAIGIILLIMLTGVKLYAMYPLITYGGALVVFRFMLLSFCPILLQMTIPIVDIINALLVAMLVVVDVAIGAVDAIMATVNTIIDVINDVSKFFGGHKVTNFHFTLQKFAKITTITYSEFRTVVRTLPLVCKNYDSMPSIVEFFMKYGLHTYTCSFVRFLWPLPTFYNIMEALLSWTYYGDARPNPHNINENCFADQGVSTYDFVCSGLGVGYLFLEFFFPTLVVFIFATTIGPGLWRLLKASLYSIYTAILITLKVTTLFLDIVTV